jgi:hypothetical protein
MDPESTKLVVYLKSISAETLRAEGVPEEDLPGPDGAMDEEWFQVEATDNYILIHKDELGRLLSLIPAYHDFILTRD